MRMLIGTALAAILLSPLAGCDDIVDAANLDRGAVEVENGTSFVLQELYHPPCGQSTMGPDRIAGHSDVRPGDVLEIDLPPTCMDFKGEFSDGKRRVITRVTPSNDQRQRITFR